MFHINNPRYSRVHAKAQVLNQGTPVFDVIILPDTGALHASYISQDIVKQLPLEAYETKAVNKRARLADSATCLEVVKTVTLTLQLEGCVGEITLDVIPTQEHVILGLPDLIGTFSPFFVQLVQDLVECPTPTIPHGTTQPPESSLGNTTTESQKLKHQTQNLYDIIQIISAEEPTAFKALENEANSYYEFKNRVTTSPEDDILPNLPWTAVDSVNSVTDIPFDVRLQEYYQLLEENTTSDFFNHPQFKPIMHSAKA